MFLGLAVAGIFLPLLPTTPFLLLAAYFFAKSSPGVHRWLLNSRWFGPLIQDWEKRRAISIRTKFKAIVIVLLSISLTLFFAQPNRFVTGLLLSIVAVGLFVIWRIPTYRRE